jgi:uncharacterized repeat protein (TIGR01451 family)
MFPLVAPNGIQNMKSLMAALLCVFLVEMAISSTQEKFSQVRIFATNASDFKRIQDAGLFIDHANTKLGHYSDAWLSEAEIELLRKSGVPFEILFEDWESYRRTLPPTTDAEMQRQMQQSRELFNVSHSIIGTMGYGYLSYNEVLNKLDTMRIEFPQLISQKFAIGTTYENRTIWAVRITKNPDAPTGRPEVLYHALIHAREPESMETQIYYVYWLLENYNIDPLATYILNNREIYWIPIFNVDGYEYNRINWNSSSPPMWRANRHFTTGSCGPVDLNRNYGIYQFWNSSNGGSSTDQCNGGSGTYRGTSPFSELETQAVMNFVNSRNLNSIFGAHTYGNYLIKPWAWSDPQVTPDDNKFNQFLADMKASNPVYTTGTPSQTVGYFVRGGADDWYYNDSVHTGHHIFGITPETGTSFWPAQNQIIPLAQGMLFNNQYMSLIAGPYVSPLSRTFNQGTYAPGQAGTYKVVFRNKGAIGTTNVKVTWTSSSSHISIPTTQFTYPSLASFATDSSVFGFTISSSVPNNSAIPTLLTVKLDTTTIYSTPAYVLVGTGIVVLSDSGNTFTNWTRSTGGTWAVTTAQSNSPPSSFTDSPSGNYGDNIDNSMILASPLNGASIPVLIVSFYHKYATEANYDFCSLEASNDNGATWQPVVSYSGTLSTWTRQTSDITGYANGSSQVKIRFRLTSDAGLVGDGWYVDDIRVNGYALSQAPDTGVVVRPNSFTFAGVTGRVFQDSIKINNYTTGSIQVALAESTTTLTESPSLKPSVASLDMSTIIKRLRSAIQHAHFTRESLEKNSEVVTEDPLAYATILADERRENGFGAADIFQVQYQYRTNILGSFHDFKIVLANLPDTNVVIVLSVDTDQDFGTGSFPTPLGAGPTTRDIGSEFEVLLDASGVLIDSLTPLGRIPAGIVASTANDTLTIVGLPFLLSIQKDSVLTISTESALGGINASWLSDPDRKMNIGFVATRLSQGANLFPDFAPEIGHALVGTETGVSWISEERTSLSIPSGDSAIVHITGLAAKLPGIYNAILKLTPAGRPAVNLPVQLNVTGLAQSHIVLDATSYRDTVRLGDSTTHTLTISNTGNADLIWGVLDTSTTSWASATPAFGTAPVGQSSSTIVKFNSAGLIPNTTYNSRFLIISNDQTTGMIVFPISLRVNPSVGVEENDKTIPTAFALRQNYPNPFNPETNIKYDLSDQATVTLKIYNILGQEVATLANGLQQAGFYSTEWNGKNQLGSKVAGGVYFYRLEANPADGGAPFTSLKKMLMLK